MTVDPLTFYVLIVINLVIGIAVGWFAGGVWTKAHTPSTPAPTPQPKPAKNDDRKQYANLLGDMSQKLQGHADSLAECQNSLKENPAEGIEQIATQMQTANDAFESSAASMVQQLEGLSCDLPDDSASVISEVTGYRQETNAFNDLLAAATTEGASALSPDSPVIKSLSQLLVSNMQLNSELEKKQEELNFHKSMANEARNEARVDPLTKLPNRRAFEEKLAEIEATYSRFDEKYMVAIFDIDNFKSLNDTYGHAVGDDALSLVGTIFNDKRRSTDHVARIGGEEFAIVLPRVDLQGANAAMERFRKSVEAASLRSGEHMIQLTMSGGVAEVNGVETGEEVLERADEALYSAKKSGKNRVHMHLEDGCIPLADAAAPKPVTV